MDTRTFSDRKFDFAWKRAVEDGGGGSGGRGTFRVPPPSTKLDALASMVIPQAQTRWLRLEAGQSPARRNDSRGIPAAAATSAGLKSRTEENIPPDPGCVKCRDCRKLKSGNTIRIVLQIGPAACFPSPIAGGALLAVRGSMSPKTISTLSAFAMRQFGSCQFLRHAHAEGS